MDGTCKDPLNITTEEMEIIAELLESERGKLLIEIRHTDHRAFRENLRQRLALVDGLVARCGHSATNAPQGM